MMIIRQDLPDHRVIVGCTRDAQILVGEAAFNLLASGLHSRIITIADAKFMVACDAGSAWEKMLASTPVCGIDERGTFCFIKGGLVAPKKETENPEVAVVLDNQHCFDGLISDGQ